MKVVKENQGDLVTETVATEKQAARVTLVIDQQIMKILKESRLDVNQLFILLALHDDYVDLLDQYDEANTNNDVLINQYQELYIHGFIEDGTTDRLFQLSPKGEDLVITVKMMSDLDQDEKETERAFRLLCETYLHIFPKIKLPSGKYAHVSLVEIEKKMRVFIKTYRPRFKKDNGFILTHEDVLRATKAYVDRYAKENYKFMATSSYFIQKKDSSGLADEILAMKQGINKSQTNITVQ